MSKNDRAFMEEAIRLAKEGVQNELGGPFGAVVVQDGRIIGRGQNRVLKEEDPTAHAEMVAIREACRHLQHFQLTGCTIYTSCEPCPMCLGAIYWARPNRIVYACSREDASELGFDDGFIYRELALPVQQRSMLSEQLMRPQALEAMQLWAEKEDKTAY